MPVDALLRGLRELYPPERLMTEPGQVAPYESDALTSFRCRPEAVVLPQTREEVVATVRACHREGVPFVARGSGTSLSGGSLPVAGGIVIGLNRLDRVLRVDPTERVAVVEPGVINAHVTRAAAAIDIRLAEGSGALAIRARQRASPYFTNAPRAVRVLRTI